MVHLRLAVASVVLSLSIPTAAEANTGCQKRYSRADFHQATRKAHRDPVRTNHEVRTLRRVFRCQARPRVSRPILRRHAHRYKRAWRARFYWDIQWRRLSSYDQAWAINTSMCESGRNPATNTGNGYYGAFQFLPSTAYAAGFKVLPHYTSLHEQDVRSVRWRNVAGASQWPVCGV